MHNIQFVGLQPNSLIGEHSLAEVVVHNCTCVHAEVLLFNLQINLSSFQSIFLYIEMQ